MASVAAPCGCGSGLAATDCLFPATPLAKLIGRRYALGLLSLIANHGTVRFNELRSRLGVVRSSTLATRLADLEEAGIIRRALHPERPPRGEASLTRRRGELSRAFHDLLLRGDAELDWVLRSH